MNDEMIDLSMNAAVGSIEIYLDSRDDAPKTREELNKLTHEIARKVAEKILAAPLDEQLY